MPEYTGPMRAWTCQKCSGTIHYRPGTLPPSWLCNMMGCGGTVLRTPERDYGAQPQAMNDGSHDG